MRRVFCVVGGAFLLGLLVASFLPLKGQVIFMITCLIVLCVGLFKKSETRVYIVTISVFIMLGTFSFAAKTVGTYEKVILLDGVTTNLSGTVTSKTVRANGEYTYEIKTSSVGTDLADTSTVEEFKLTLYANKYLNVDLYDSIQLQNARFFRPTTSDMFDSERYNRGKNIFICANYKPEDDSRDAIITKPYKRTLMQTAAELNQDLCKKVDDLMNYETAMLVKGVILGQREGMNYTLNESYKDAGVAHLFSISGMHISILSAALLLLFKKMNKYTKVPIVLTAIVGYIFLSGAQISAIRSGIMLSVMLISMLFYREGDSANSLFLAGFIITLVDPYAIMDLGFLMSFLATFGVIVVAPVLHRALCKSFNLSDTSFIKLLQFICISLCAEIMLLPIFILSFHTISLISPVTNLITSVTIVPVVILGFLSVLLINTPFLAPLLLILNPVVSFQNLMVTILGSLKFSIIGVDYSIYIVGLILCIALMLIVLVWYHNSSDSVHIGTAFVSCGLIFVTCFVINSKEINNDTFIYVVGDNSVSNIVIATKRSATVISTADDSYIDKQTLTFLKGKGIKEIDALILSYYGFYSFKDTVALAQSLPVNTIFYNELDPSFEQILEQEVYSKISPIEDKMCLEIGEETSITFDYLTTSINMEVSCKDSQLYIGNYDHAAANDSHSIHFIRANLPEKILTGIPEESAEPLLNPILLENHYTSILPKEFIPSSNKIIEIRINSKGQLIFPEVE